MVCIPLLIGGHTLADHLKCACGEAEREIGREGGKEEEEETGRWSAASMTLLCGLSMLVLSQL